MILEKMHPTLREQFFEQLYVENIVDSSEKLLLYEDYAIAINAEIPVSCYTNFRDALFHFRKVVSSVEETEIERQSFAVKEHLSRSLTDASSSILHHLSCVAEGLLLDNELSSEVKLEIRESLHNMKKANLRKRFAGMMISNDNTANIGHDEIIEIVDGLYKLLNEECPEKFAELAHTPNDDK